MYTIMHPILEPYQSGMLQVSPIHQIYYEVSGNPHGKTVVYLHGGPGAGTTPTARGFFNPKKYRIVLFDQRGCGKSLPYGCIEENTTWDLVADMEVLRQFLGIDKWQVFGGSWGSTLALAYAQTHPQYVEELILRGIFLCRPSEIIWLTQNGANHIYPDYWANFLAPVAPDQRHDLVTAYQQLLSPNNPNRTQMFAAASAWAQWESHIVHLHHNDDAVARYADGYQALAIARLENHYFAHQGWLDGNKALLHPDNIAKIRHIPTVIVQGRYDICTPAVSAWDLKQAFPEAELHWTLAGHASLEENTDTLSILLDATDRFV